MSIKAHQVLLTDEEWQAVLDAYPRGIPVLHPLLREFAHLASTPESVVVGAEQFRVRAEQCQCWICLHMLSLPVITGYHMYVATLNRICAGGNPRTQLN